MKKMLLAAMLAAIVAPTGPAEASVCLITPLGTRCEASGPVEATIVAGPFATEISNLAIDGTPLLGATGYGLSPAAPGFTNFVVYVNELAVLTVRVDLRPLTPTALVQLCAAGSNCSYFFGVSNAPGSIRFYSPLGGCTALRYSPTPGIVPC